MVLGFAWYLGIFVSFTRTTEDERKTREEEDVLHLLYYSLTCLIATVFHSNKLWRWIVVDKYAYDVLPDSFAVVFCGVQIGVYLAMLMAVRIEPVKKDVKTMTIHHLLTVTTVGLCVLGGHSHACVVILLLHDCCDVPLLVMKMAGRRNYQLIESFAYCLVVAGFVVFRLIAFPWVCFEAATASFNYITPIIIAINLGLWVMHLYWLRILLQQGYRRLTGKTTFDPREEEEKEIKKD